VGVLEVRGRGFNSHPEIKTSSSEPGALPSPQHKRSQNKQIEPRLDPAFALNRLAAAALGVLFGGVWVCVVAFITLGVVR